MNDAYFKKMQIDIKIASLKKQIKLLELEKERLEQVETTEQQLDLLGGER
ncbi:MAG: hypothetical protein GY907_00695 [Bacteroidetes bacterium]|nr:hypothetical protein [Bacteroidota bacterium]